MDIVIDLKTGEIEIIYAATVEEPCVLCDDRDNCDRTLLHDCGVPCG